MKLSKPKLNLSSLFFLIKDENIYFALKSWSILRDWTSEVIKEVGR